MNTITNWMNDKFAPVVNRITRNPWIQGIQESILSALPFVLVGSFITVINVFQWQGWLTFLPDISPISSFTFGLFSLYLSYLIPYNIMEKKKLNKTKTQAGLVGIAFFLMIAFPTLDAEGNIIFQLNALGSGGMLASLLSGIVVALIMSLFAKIKFFKEDTAIPDFITTWFETLIPITIIITIGFIFTFVLKINIFNVIYELFKPILNIGQSYVGYILLVFIGNCFLYTFGISTWVIFPISSVIYFQGIADNAALVAAGSAATNIALSETMVLWAVGGGGVTLSLNILMVFWAKSAQLKAIGKASIVPSIMNINEPLVFGAPIAFNPTLMIPFWLNGFIAPTLTFIVMKIGLVPIPHEIYGFWYLPSLINGFLVSGIQGLIWTLVIFAISAIIYYPFFKVFDKQMLKEESGEE